MKDAFLLRQELDGRSRPSFASAPTLADSLEVVWRGYIADPSCVDKPERFAAAYTRWGSELARHLFGEFAVALYDHTARTLFVTHDDFGIVPVFYAEIDGELIVSTHLDVLIGVTNVRKLDEEFIADYIGEGWHFGSRTPYSHVRRLMPGESLVSRNGKVTVSPGKPLSDEPLSVSESEAPEEHLLELVKEAVAGAIHPGQRVWCELSGGLDSSSIFSIAASAKTPNFSAFSFIYGQSRRCDEREWIDIALQAYQVPWHTLDADELRPLSEMPAYRYAEPTMKLFMSARERAYRHLLSKNNVDVVLSGEGGDAIFLGDNPPPYHLADYFRRGQLSLGMTGLQHWAANSRQKRPSMYWFLRFVLRPSLRHVRRQMLDYDFTEIPWINAEYAKRQRLRTRGRRSNAMHLGSVAASGYMEGVMRGALASGVPYQDPIPASQFRHPLLYRPLVEFMQRTPWALQLAPGSDRVLQRRAFVGILPERIRTRVSKTAGDPWMYNGIRDGVAWRDRLTRNPRIVARGYADPDRWSQAVRDAALGKTVGIRFFHASASLEAWLQELESADFTLNVEPKFQIQCSSAVSNGVSAK